MEEIVLTATNVKCGGCTDIIRAGLEPLDGVSEVTVDANSGRVVIKGDALSRAVLTTKLAELGYPAQ